ncbi:glucosaminidase domain-containing protein [Candidatus Pelagibacter bacterium]|nr:glucosaminidase domain-containing protein [Candidatus Pelagibacter bacterium]
MKNNQDLFEKKSKNNLLKIFLSSFLTISFFYIAPIFINFADKNFYTKEFTNNSKKILAYTLNKEDKNKIKNETLDEKEVLVDIYSLNNSETEAVYLSAASINKLFKETDYNLNDVRQNKLVKPVALTLLPTELKMIENSKKRKEFFIQIVLPLIIKENNIIKKDRRTLFDIINKSNNTTAELNWLEKKYKQYGVRSKDLSTLKIRMDEIPASLAIAQAAKETGWGTSRFAQEGNALFGQWTWSGEGLKPKEAEEGADHKVMKFKILQASVRAYQRNLNTHPTYKDLRKARAEFRDLNKPLDSLELSNYLNKYAETGNQYVEVLQQIIKQNKLKDFDDAKLLPSSSELESLI